MNAIVPFSDTLIDHPLVESAAGYADASLATNTKRAYAAAWRGFIRWCGEQEFASIPARPEVVALYIPHRAD